MQIQQPYVDLASAQTIPGAKSFTATLTASGALSLGFSELLAPITSAATATIQTSANRLADATAGNITLTLPVASTSANCRITITKVDATANTVTIAPQAAGTIGGAANVVLTAQYQSVTLQNINSAVAGAWVVIGKT